MSPTILAKSHISDLIPENESYFGEKSMNFAMFQSVCFCAPLLAIHVMYIYSSESEQLVSSLPICTAETLTGHINIVSPLTKVCRWNLF